MDACRRSYFRKIQIWNGWYSRVVSELRRLSPFLELVCACAQSAPPVLSELPPRRVARHPHVVGSPDAVAPPPSKRWRHTRKACPTNAHQKPTTFKKTQENKALREFRASLLPIVLMIVWNVKKYGAARACPPDPELHSLAYKCHTSI